MLARLLFGVALTIPFVLTTNIPANAQCPRIRVDAPTKAVKAGYTASFVAMIAGGNANVMPMYNWTVSAGTIASGQGTSDISVDTAGLPGNATITATVDVGGYPRSCRTTASASASVEKAEAKMFDSFGKLAVRDEQARLENVVVALQAAPSNALYIFAYGGRRSVAGEAASMMKRSSSYITKNQRIDGSRVITVDGGYKEEPTLELWMVPAEAVPPSASPTVDPSEVKVGKPAVKKPAKPRPAR